MTNLTIILIFLTSFVLLTPIVGMYLAAVFKEKPFWAYRALGWLERLCYRTANINPAIEMHWTTYGKALLIFNILGFVLLFLIQLLQGYLPLNPQNFNAVPTPTAFNTAISFVTNTNWQSYSGETTLSYLTQMLGLTSQNFLSAATGMAALMALIRGLLRRSSQTIGNFWADLIRTIIYVLLPFSIITGIILAENGVIQTLSPYVEATTIEKNQQQIIPLGPVASQIAIKQLGTNGGGFFNANSAHPYENPNPLTNFLETLAIVLIPAASLFAYGIIIDAKRHAWVLFTVMLALWAMGMGVASYAEWQVNPLIAAHPMMEGKETRLGVANSVLWSVSTTATSSGSVNAMLSSLSPLAGGVCLLNMMAGEVIFGGIGVGLCSMIMYVLLTVFISGLMVGRSPEYLGKKIEGKEMQWVVIAVLAPTALILIGAGLSSVLPIALSSLSHTGPHGLTELLYAFASGASNNGSAFSSLNASTTYYNLVLGVVILLGRIAIILSSIAIAGLLARKKATPPSLGTFSTDSLLFSILLTFVILLMGALSFFPAFSLGPLTEHLLMQVASR